MVYIASEKAPQDNPPDFGLEHFQMPFYPAYEGLEYRLLWILDKLFHTKESRFSAYVAQHMDVGAVDCILCSTFSEFPLLTASQLAKRYNKPLIVDLRDIIEQWGDSSYLSHPLPKGLRWLQDCYEKRSIKLRNRILQQAQGVTTISTWHKHWLEQWNPKTYLIYNGFDKNAYGRKDEKNDKFIISYIGRIYDFKLRNPLLLFQAMSQLIEDKLIEPDHVRIVFHTEDSAQVSLQELASQYKLESYTSSLGYISNQEAIELMHQSSICLLLTQEMTSKGPFGIMTTKFFEILGTEKPLLCIPNDNGCLNEAIQYTQVGVAAHNIQETKRFISEKYEEWKQNGFTHQIVIHKEEFTRQYQAQQMEDILTTLCH